MKKRGIKKGFAVVLSLALVLQCIPVTAFAAVNSPGVEKNRLQTFGYGGGVTSGANYVTNYDSSTYNDSYFNYVALGDSITQGFSLEGFNAVNSENPEANNENVFFNISNSPNGTYPKQLAALFKEKGVGNFNVKNMGMPSLTTRGIYDILRSKYEAKDVNGNLYDYGAYYFCVDGTMIADEGKLNAAILSAGHSPSEFADKAAKTDFLMSLDSSQENLKPYFIDANGKYLSDSNYYIEGVQPIVKKSFLPDTKDYTSLFRDQLADADLVTVAIGSNDIMRKLNTMLFYDNAVPDNQIIQNLNNLMTLANGGDMDMSSMEMGNGAPVSVILSNILNINELLNEGVNDFMNDLPLAVGEVDKYTPDDTEICLLGLYNPFGIREYAYLIATLVDGKKLTPTLVKSINTTVDLAYKLVTELPASMVGDLYKQVQDRVAQIKGRASGQALSLDLSTTVNDVFFLVMPLLVATVGNVVESPLDKMKSFTKTFAEEHGYTYIPFDKVRSRGSLDPHPTAEGHADIAAAILAAVGEFTPKKQEKEFPFIDVCSNDWFFNGVKYCYDNDIMNGVSDFLFAPQTVMNRAMIVTMLYRREHEPSVGAYQPFADVPAGSYYDEAVRWAYANKIVTGYDSLTFAPLDSITREQLATIFYRYTKFKNMDTTFKSYLYKFSDASKISAYAIDAMAWAYYHGIINGITPVLIEPQGGATRAQAATMIQRYDNAF